MVVAIEETETIDALERLVREKVDGLAEEADGRALVCRVSLTGRGALHAELRREGAVVELQKRLRERMGGRDPFIWVQRLVAETRPEVDLEDRRQRGDLLAEVLTIAREYEAEDGALSKLFEEALTELWDNPRVDKAQLGRPTEEDVATLLREAELLCLDHLEGEE
jgi:hypothetical protein